MRFTFGIIGLLILGTSCILSENKNTTPLIKVKVAKDIKKKDTVTLSKFDRTETLSKIMTKKLKKAPLIVHAFIPLCDNKNQGIVPVNSRLGDGDNLKTNLYWGAGYGFKSYFKKLVDWELALSQYLNDTILERVVFKKTMDDSTLVYFIADAYNGNKMEQCLLDYSNALNGKLNSSLTIEDSITLQIHSHADLLIFNGHNGLMDEFIPLQHTKIPRKKDAIAIACYSFSYFEEHWYSANTYPLLSTTHLLAPEAYTLEAAVNSWAKGQSGIEIRNAAAKAYSDKHSCSYKTAQKLFKSGW